MQGWKQSKLIASGNQGWSYPSDATLRDRPAFSVSTPRLVTVLCSNNGAKAMSITQKMHSDLSCMFTLHGSHPSQAGKIDPDSRCNYDYLESNRGNASHRFPSLHLPLNSFDHASEYGPATVLEAGFRSLCRAWDNSKERALIAKGERQTLTLDTLDARDTANRPDSIPSDMNVLRVTRWEQASRHFIPAKPAKGASLKELVAANTKPDGFMIETPAHPVGTVLGTLSTEAWRRGEGHTIPVHAPQSLPGYQVPVRDKTEGELAAEAWLAMPGRTSKPASRSSRLARLQARHWDKGDGNSGTQPVMSENASLRALGRINRAVRFNRAAAE